MEPDLGDGAMHCSKHPCGKNYGGICAFCLQEKLGKLVASSNFPLPVNGYSSNSSTPSFRSENNGVSSISFRPTSEKCRNDSANNTSRARLPFLLTKRKKVMGESLSFPLSGGGGAGAGAIVFKRSKSTTTPRRGQFLNSDDGEDYFPRKRSGFWSFLYQSSKKSSKASKTASFSTIATPQAAAVTAAEGSSAVERKVSRSRSVGCGSRSFSGDLFERISTGFGDCALRRVESEREGKSKAVVTAAVHGGGGDKVRCGGIFSGFIMNSSSSSSSYWVSSSGGDVNGKSSSMAGNLDHGRSKSWVWAFASPIRAFSKPSSKDGKRDLSSKNITPNLSAIPSLLTVR